MQFPFKSKSISWTGVFVTIIFCSMTGIYAKAGPSNGREHLVSKGLIGSRLNMLEAFVDTGVIKDRALKNAIKKSRWSPQEVRSAISRIYKVDKKSLAIILKSSSGVTFSINKDLKKDLFKAILDDSLDGTISTIGILSYLKTFPRDLGECISPGNKEFTCDQGKCNSDLNCKTILSWYIFLPACLQAAQFHDGIRSKAYRRHC